MKGCDDVGIVIEGLKKSFAGKTVLDNFSICVADGENVAVMGESGSGKTTLLNIIAGIIKQDSGSMSGIEGKKISFVFQEDRLAENFTVYRNIKLACEKTVAKSDIIGALRMTGLDASVIDAKVNTLSGGMKRRVSIVRALLYDGDILLLDEPTKGLDEQNKCLVVDYILTASKDKTVLWVTHDEDEAKYVADRIITIG